MQFDVYLFDFDGTLMDTRESLVPVFRAGYAVVGREVSEEEAERWMHLNLTQSFKDSGVDEKYFGVVCKAIIDSLDMPESIRLIHAFPDAIPTLKKLRALGKRIGIVSNNAASHIRLVLETLHIDVPFDCIVGSDMFLHGKPHPEPIQVALRLLQEKEGPNICYVGDSLQDPETGINAGIGGVLLDRDGRHSDYPGVRIRSLKELC
ncbi:MAG: HAD family hydrolase [Bacilli bacterium]|nr:HAD family hydrolase [Bacilli bacterium]